VCVDIWFWCDGMAGRVGERLEEAHSLGKRKSCDRISLVGRNKVLEYGSLAASQYLASESLLERPEKEIHLQVTNR